VPIYRIAPGPPLDQHIEWLWHYTDYHPDHDREHVLPDGGCDLIINLESRPRRLFQRANPQEHRAFRRGWISGAQSEFLIIDALPASTMIGAHFRPGAAARFMGLPAPEFAAQVVELDDIWRAGVWEWRDQLMEARGPREKFTVFERFLNERLARSPARLDAGPGISNAIEGFMRAPELRHMGRAADDMGVSRRHFIAEFRRHVGLTPKTFCRIRRFQDVLVAIQAKRPVGWADLACSCGYYDQSHFIRDFIRFAGMNPSSYLDRRLDGDPNFARR